MIDKIKAFIKPVTDVILFFYNKSVYSLIMLDEKQRRASLHKQRYPNKNSSTYKLKEKLSFITSKMSRKKFSLSEQKIVVDALLTSTKFGNPITEPFEFLATLNKTRFQFKQSCLDVRENLNTKPLFSALEGKEIFPNEYIAMLAIAQKTGDFISAYEYIKASIEDKRRRKSAFLFIMAQPIFTLVVAVGIEIYISLYLIEELIAHIPREDAPPVMSSYLEIRDLLLNKKLILFTKIAFWSAVIYVIFKQKATQYLMSLLLLQLPIITKLIIQWEMSKFFSSMNSLIQSGASLKESLDTSIDVVNNPIIKASLLSDINSKVDISSDLYNIFKDAIYIDDKVRNQLFVSYKSGSDSSEVLESVSKEYAESMKKLLDSPMGLVIPLMLFAGCVYLFTRLLPLFTEVSSILENIGG